MSRYDVSVVEINDKIKVNLQVGVQGFTISPEYANSDRISAEWMAEMLSKAMYNVEHGFATRGKETDND